MSGFQAARARNRAIALAVLNGASYVQGGGQHGLGRQRVLAIVQRACRQASPEAFADLAISSVSRGRGAGTVTARVVESWEASVAWGGAR